PRAAGVPLRRPGHARGRQHCHPAARRAGSDGGRDGMSTNARPIDVAIAAVALLNSGPVQATFGALTFTAKRAYRPTFDLKQHKAGLTVTVIPVLLNESALSRQTVEGQVAVQVAV